MRSVRRKGADKTSLVFAVVLRSLLFAAPLTKSSCDVVEASEHPRVTIESTIQTGESTTAAAVVFDGLCDGSLWHATTSTLVLCSILHFSIAARSGGLWKVDTLYYILYEWCGG